MFRSLSQGLREIILVGYFSVALYILICLITFHLDDAGWTHTGTGQQIHNSGGAVGAWLSDFMLSFLGLSSYLIPGMLIYQGWYFYQTENDEDMNWTIPLRWLGLIITITASTTLIYLHFWDLGNELPNSAGGILGKELGNSFADAFGLTGATILLLATFASAITLLTSISWLSTIDAIGRYALIGFQAINHQFSQSFNSEPLQSTPTKKTSPNPGDDYFTALAPPEYQLEIPKNPHPPEDDNSTLKIPTMDEDNVKSILKDNFNDDELTSFQPEEALDFSEPNDPFSKQANTSSTNELLLNQQEQPTQAEPTNVIKSVDNRQEKTRPSRKLLPKGTIPPLDELDSHRSRVRGYTKQNLEDMADKVEQILGEFGVKSTVKEVHPGPVITRFELDLAPGTKASRVTNLSKDLARAMLVQSVRVVEVIPGKPVIGLEIPNSEREMVTLKDILSSDQYQQESSPVTMALGKDISGLPVVADLAKMPHLLVAGTTGSGKSVAINAIILSLLYKATPEQVRMIMVDPKMLELSVYEDIPHLLTPVVTDMNLASQSLNWCVAEMERRYKLMSMLGVRNLSGFNQKVNDAIAAGTPIKDPLFEPVEGINDSSETPILESLPVIVIIIDELADMMMIVGKKVEVLIARLAQKARAAGLHLILATQRPSVDVLTGLIKANVPTRISFQVSSKIDSRTILDQGGAEALLGNGDMLYLPPGTSMPIRAHGAFVSDQEVHRVVEFLKRTGRPQYISSILDLELGEGSFDGLSETSSDQDALYDQAVYFVTQSRKASISSVQRKFRIGYNRAARIVEEMENTGIISAAETNGSRSVLAPPPAGS